MVRGVDGSTGTNVKGLEVANERIAEEVPLRNNKSLIIGRDS